MSVNISVERLKEKIRPWRHARQIGMAAHRAMEVPQLMWAEREPEKRQKLAILETFVRDPFSGQDAPQHQRRRLAQLPPSVLPLLDALLPRAGFW
jgi:hypothetical protein